MRVSSSYSPKGLTPVEYSFLMEPKMRIELMTYAFKAPSCREVVENQRTGLKLGIGNADTSNSQNLVMACMHGEDLEHFFVSDEKSNQSKNDESIVFVQFRCHGSPVATAC
jgi:hypothetical protein